MVTESNLFSTRWLLREEHPPACPGQVTDVEVHSQASQR